VLSGTARAWPTDRESSTVVVIAHPDGAGGRGPNGGARSVTRTIL
jgi:hypothetical protein